MPLPKSTRIGIVGAGPAGLAAAEALQECGYKNITIIEQKDRVGGQAFSCRYKDVVYELGSLQPIASKNLFHLIKKYNIHVGKKNLSKNQNPNTPVRIKIYSLEKRECLVDFTKNKLLGFPPRYWLPAMFDMMRFLRILFKYRKLSDIGYNLSTSQMNELLPPYEQWIDKQNFKIIGYLMKMMGTIAAFSNPEHKETVPAIGVIKIFLQLVQFPQRYLNGKLKFVKEGYQELWNRVASHYHVMLNTNITKIIRKPNQIEVNIENQPTMIFDKLIITCSLTHALSMLDVTVEEKELFEKVHYSPGWRVAFLAKNLPHDALYAFPEPYMSKGYGPYLQTFYPEGQVDDKVWLYTGMLTSNKNELIEPYLKNAEKMLREQFNGEVIAWLESAFWPEYTPYFYAEDIKNNIYQKLEALQGKNNTYYLGGTLSGSSHATVVDYSFARIKDFLRGSYEK